MSSLSPSPRPLDNILSSSHTKQQKVSKATMEFAIAKARNITHYLFSPVKGVGSTCHKTHRGMQYGRPIDQRTLGCFRMVWTFLSDVNCGRVLTWPHVGYIKNHCTRFLEEIHLTLIYDIKLLGT